MNKKYVCIGKKITKIKINAFLKIKTNKKKIQNKLKSWYKVNKSQQRWKSLKKVNETRIEQHLSAFFDVSVCVNLTHTDTVNSLFVTQRSSF